MDPTQHQLLLAATAVNLQLIQRRRRRRGARRFWVHPLLRLRHERGHFAVLYPDLLAHPDKFYNYTRMTIPMFNKLLGLVREDLYHMDTTYRDAISPEQRLLVTLRFLATGNSYTSLHYDFRMGISTVSRIVRETCAALWRRLVPLYMAPPSQEQWGQIARGFWRTTNMPHCLGAVDGKHVRIVQPPGSGSTYYNYRHFFSVVLMAIADSNYNFLYIDVGSHGSSADSFIFLQSRFHRLLDSSQIPIPAPCPLPGTAGPDFPFFFVGDEAFALSGHVMRPYASRGLTRVKRVFNYRLSRARRMVECTFGILAGKWRVLHTAMNLDVENAIKVIKAACILHNFCRAEEGGPVEVPEQPVLGDIHLPLIPGPIDAAHLRGRLAGYFTTPAGRVPWQDDIP